MKRRKSVCKNSVANLLLPYLNDDVTRAEEKRINAHLLKCESCREELEFLQIAKRLEQKRK